MHHQGWSNFKSSGTSHHVETLSASRLCKVKLDASASQPHEKGTRSNGEQLLLHTNNRNFNSGHCQSSLESHIGWWNSFWNKSQPLRFPDPVLQNQWVYGICTNWGSAARQGHHQISLTNVIWTALAEIMENYRLGKRLSNMIKSTQLSYWHLPISGNHLDLETRLHRFGLSNT